MTAPSIEDARRMGAVGGPAVEAERLAFEAWMAGHCWALCATWTGTQYRSDDEASGDVNPHAMRTRQLWAAWRDRAALAAPAVPTVKDSLTVAPAVPPGWQPIETAPNGVMLLFADMQAAEARHWAFCGWRHSGLRGNAVQMPDNTARTATHWKPLGPAPEAAAPTAQQEPKP